MACGQASEVRTNLYLTVPSIPKILQLLVTLGGLALYLHPIHTTSQQQQSTDADNHHQKQPDCRNERIQS